MAGVRKFGDILYNIEWRQMVGDDIAEAVDLAMEETDVTQCTVDDLRNACFSDSEICEIMQVLHKHAVFSLI